MGALLAILLATSAWGASFDCARATQPVERAICGDAETSALDERLAAVFRRALATPWGETVRDEQRAWLRGQRNAAAADPARLRDAYRRRIAALEASVALAADPALSGLTEARIGAACVPLPPDPESPEGGTCRVRETGALGTLEGRRLVFAVYAFPDPQQPDSVMLAAVATLVFAQAPDGRYALLFADRRGTVGCGTPRLIQGAPGAMLHLQCHQYGTGNFNAESVYAWRDGAWRSLDIESWTRELARRLPEGLEVWKGIFPDYARLTARTPLWRPGDGNCCPTGGRADIALAWRGERLVLRDLRVTRGEAAARY